jgi:diamine N-acetyltransferase
MKQQVPPFSFDPIRLRLLQEDDLRSTLEWRNRDGVRQQFFSGDLITWESHLAWFTRYAAKADDFIFIVEELESGQRIGQVALYDIELDRSEAEVGRFIVAPEFAGKGLMRLAIEALAQIAADTFGLHRLRLEVKASNTRAYRLYDSLRFKVIKHDDGVIHMSRTVQDAIAD